MLHWLQVWRQMHDFTGRDIEKRAVMEFISYFEEQMNMVISQSVKELKKRNSLSSVQSLKARQRIDSECVKSAIKAISNNGHSSPSARTGGKSKKEREKHSQEDTEVA